jgi:hypothetical protein
MGMIRRGSISPRGRCGFHGSASEAKNGDFRFVHDGREMGSADAPLVGDGERAAFESSPDLAVAGFAASSSSSRDRSSMLFLSTSRITGTIRPASVSTAMPIWIVILLKTISWAASSRLLLSAGCFLSGGTTARKAKLVSVNRAPFFRKPAHISCADALSVGDVALSNCVTCGMAFQFSLMRRAITWRKGERLSS